MTARRLIGSDWFQERWGKRVVITEDRDNQGQYDTTAGGSRISTGIPESLGKGGAIRIIDDPHKTDEVESETVRSGVIRAYDECGEPDRTIRSTEPKSWSCSGSQRVIYPDTCYRNGISFTYVFPLNTNPVGTVTPLSASTTLGPWRANYSGLSGSTKPG